jgi:hypothetical protein
VQLKTLVHENISLKIEKEKPQNGNTSLANNKK